MADNSLGSRFADLPPSPNAAGALAHLTHAAERNGGEEALAKLLAESRTEAFLTSVLGDSPFLLDLASKDILRLVSVMADEPQRRIPAILRDVRSAEWQSRAEAMSGLRRARQDLALTLGLADLGRVISLETVTASLTDFADAAIAAALRFALSDAERRGKWKGTAESGGLFVLAMGKQGAHELNYSSDIDLITLYEPEAPGLAASEEPSVFWVRIVREVVALLQERTADGYVFRVDLRLRPDPGATAVAISAPAALSYYESMGQNWERAALIKARACAGNITAGEAFLKEIAPFIWRKYLDFAAIADIHSIKRQVHAHRGHSEVRVRGHDIKRGRGGIREVEFFAQTQQLIAGGRDPALRGRRTRDMLAQLAERGWITSEVRDEMDAAYRYLREVEHRLQVVKDEQTHTMPTSDEEVARIARLMGEEDPHAFETSLGEHMRGVARRYSELFEDAPALSADMGSLVFTGGDDDPETLATLAGIGFKDPKLVTETVRAWHFGRFPATRSTRAREELTEITPALLAALARGGNPDAALLAFDGFLRALPAGAQLFALLANNRELLDLLATILACAPHLAAAFVRRPHLVDAFIDPSFLDEWDDRNEWRRRLDASLRDATRFEAVLDRVRLFATEQRFLISVQLLTGAATPAEVAHAFSDLAEMVVVVLYEHTRAEFERQHGQVAGGSSTVVALGRLGSREMTAGSDLDLIVLYDHDPDAGPSDGPKPLEPTQYFSRLTQRIVASLSAPTAEGVAYPVDLRLRPSGRAGPLATHVESFERYQMEEAWVWEHMAISRGRPIAGDEVLSKRVTGIIDQIVAKERHPRGLADEVYAMRGRVEGAKVASGIFDVKLAPGGLIDCEFISQYLVLAGLGRIEGEPTVDTLRRAGEEGRLEQEDAELLVRSISLQTAIIQVLRAAEVPDVESSSAPEGLRRRLAVIAKRAADQDRPGADEGNFEMLAGELARTQERTRSTFERLLGRGPSAI